VKLIVSPGAQQNLERLYEFLADKNPDAARRVVGTLTRAVESLDMLPDRGRPSATVGVRELVVPFGRSAYIVRYVHMPGTEEIIILRIWHGREKR
jgi:plasmid stabilization system protein ParE